MNLRQLCQAIIAGYAAEKSGMDDDMIQLLVELGDHAEDIIDLEDALQEKGRLALVMYAQREQARQQAEAYRRAICDAVTVLETEQDWQEALSVLNEAIKPTRN